MTNRYYLSLEAEQDIEEVIEYLLQENIPAADKFADAVYSAFERLAEYPEIGHFREDLTSAPIRFWPFKWHYLIIYNPKIPIEIVRILSGYRDIAAMLKERYVFDDV